MAAVSGNGSADRRPRPADVCWIPIISRELHMGQELRGSRSDQPQPRRYIHPCCSSNCLDRNESRFYLGGRGGQRKSGRGLCVRCWNGRSSSRVCISVWVKGELWWFPLRNGDGNMALAYV